MYRSLSLSPQKEKQIVESKKCVTQYITDMNYVIDYLKGNDVITPQDANKMFSNYKANIHLFENTIESLKNGGIRLMSQTEANEIRNAQTANLAMFTVILLSIVGIIIFSFFFAAGICRPVKLIIGILKEMVI